MRYCRISLFLLKHTLFATIFASNPSSNDSPDLHIHTYSMSPRTIFFGNSFTGKRDIGRSPFRNGECPLPRITFILPGTLDNSCHRPVFGRKMT